MTQPIPLERPKIRTRSRNQNLTVWLSAMLLIVGLEAKSVRAEQPPPPCHANPNAAADEATVRNRGHVVALPAPLTDRLPPVASSPLIILAPQIFYGTDPSIQTSQY